jgi:hypothetical protein
MTRRLSLGLVLGLLGATACAGQSTGNDGAFGDDTSDGESEGDEEDGDDDGPTSNGEDSDDDEDDGEDTDDGSEDDGDIPKLDVGSEDEPCVDYGEMHSYIWVANSGEGTVSKIDTQSMEEEGRYLAREDAAGSPSRTSVSLTGDVAVANRWGGITKIHALPERCDEYDTPQFATSSGKDDVLSWADEDCRAWHTEFPGITYQRPVAWTRGVEDEEACEITGQRVWSTTKGDGDYSVNVVRLMGADGSVEETIPVPDVLATHWGPYGGAVDAEGNFFFSFYGGSKDVVVVDYEDLSYQVFESPLGVDYGITVDSQGRAWVCGHGVARLDPNAGTWAWDHHDTQPLHSGPFYHGCQTDGEGKLWVGLMSGSQQQANWLRGIDTETLEIENEYDIGPMMKGVSIDADGYVWGVMANGSNAYRIDPDTGEWDVYDGLTNAYTYSDMTGMALANAGAAG